MKFLPTFFAVVAVAVAPALPAFAGIEIEFASVQAARAVLGARDDFVVRLSPFDRSARLQVGRDVGEDEYLAHARASAMAWTDQERDQLRTAFERIRPALEELLPSFDETLLLVKTTGREEGGADAYTRANAIILTDPIPSAGNDNLERNLAHEVFHVFSRSRPMLSRALYRTIGFEHCGEVAHPASLAPRRLTNPDAPVNDHCIRLQVDGADVWAVPILYSRTERYDPSTALPFFAYLTFEMLLVDRLSGDTAQPLPDGDGRPMLVPIGGVSGFFEQVGRNTDYIIHPEEILASNFVFLALDTTDVPSPEVLERMRSVLIDAAD